MNRVRLIVNGDDFGMTRGVNRGILEAAEEGILTSTSVMVFRPFAGEVKDFHNKVPNVGIGLHVDFSKELLARVKGGENVPADEIRAEMEKQMELFERIAGFGPDHMDFHKVAVRQTETFVTDEVRLFRQPVIEVAEKYELPWRGMPGLNVVDSFHGAVYDPVSHKKADSDLERISAKTLIKILGEMGNGDYEMMSHPGYMDSEMTSSYNGEREYEVNTLTSPEVAQEIRRLGIKLIKYGQADIK